MPIESKQQTNNDKPILDLGQLLADKGMSLDGLDPKNPNNALLKINETQEIIASTDIKKLAAKLLKDADPEAPDAAIQHIIANTKMQYNDKDNPIERSLIGPMDRFMLATNLDKGDNKYTVEAIKKSGKFDDITVNKDGRVVISKNGVYHALDPKSLGIGNAIDLAKEFAADVLESFPKAAVFAGSTVGGVVAGGSTFGTGAIAGSAAGEAVTANAVLQLGKILGSHDMDQSTMATESVFDGMAVAGGGLFLKGGVQAVKAVGGLGKIGMNKALGEPTTKKLLEGVNDMATKASETVKDSFASLLTAITPGKLSNMAANKIVRNPEQMAARVKQIESRMKSGNLKLVGDGALKEANAIIDDFAPIHLEKTLGSAYDDITGVRKKAGNILIEGAEDDISLDLTASIFKNISQDKKKYKPYISQLLDESELDAAGKKALLKAVGMTEGNSIRMATQTSGVGATNTYAQISRNLEQAVSTNPAKLGPVAEKIQQIIDNDIINRFGSKQAELLPKFLNFKNTITETNGAMNEAFNTLNKIKYLNNQDRAAFAADYFDKISNDSSVFSKVLNPKFRSENTYKAFDDWSTTMATKEFLGVARSIHNVSYGPAQVMGAASKAVDAPTGVAKLVGGVAGQFITPKNELAISKAIQSPIQMMTRGVQGMTNWLKSLPYKDKLQVLRDPKILPTMINNIISPNVAEELMSRQQR